MARSHGSSDWLLKMIRNGEIDSLLETIPGVKITPNTGVPSKDDPTERELKTYLKEKGFVSEKITSISKWWPNSGPVWDYVCQAKFNGADGLILLEAKAHKSETNKAKKAEPDRDKVKDLKKAENNHTTIEQNINKELAQLRGVDNVTYEGFYQVANRIAYANKARQVFGMPILLVFLGFIGDKSFKDSWKHADQWKNEILSHLDVLKVANLTEVEMPESTRRPGIIILSKPCAEIV